MAAPLPPAIAALTVETDRLELAAVAADGRILSARAAPNPPDLSGGQPILNVEHVWRWLLAALGDLGEGFRLEAVVPLAHGRTLALLDQNGLVVPLPAALPAGALAHLEALDAAMSSRVRWLVGHAQYWGFRLTDGNVAGESSGLGEGLGLLEPRGNRPTPALRALGWQGRLPALRQPHEVLGRLSAEVRERAGLAEALPVLVGASALAARHGRLLAAGLERATLILLDDTSWRLLALNGAAEPRVQGLDGRPLAMLSVDADSDVTATAHALARAVDRLGATGPVVVAGKAAGELALLGILRPLLEGTDKALLADAAPHPAAEAAALLWALRQGRPPPRLALDRIRPCEFTSD